MTPTQPVDRVLYHASCPDGFGAACAVRAHLLPLGIEADYQPVHHSNPPPDCSGQHVVLVDFAYPREEMRALCAQAKSVTVIDHHVTAARELTGLDQECDNLSLHIEQAHSGAVLAWMHYHDSEVPRLLRYVEDRDLWRFELDGSRDITTAMAAYDFDFELWSGWCHNPEALDRLRDEGAAINRYRTRMIERYAKRAEIGNLAGHMVPIVNAPSEIISELLGELAKEMPFAAGYQDRGSKRLWSLRSTPEGLDVSAVAEQLGGGGHPRAAGFSTLLTTPPFPG